MRFFRPSSIQHLASSILLLLTFVFVPAVRAAEDTDAATAARSLALDLAGAFANDGFKLRDGHWTGTLAPGNEGQVLAVNLYAGNQYYFTIGASDKAKKLALTVCDESGKPVPGLQSYQDPARSLAAAGVSPAASGPYYVRIQMLEGSGPAEFCVVYSYK